MGLETGEWRRCRSLSFTPPASLRSHGSRPRPTRHTGPDRAADSPPLADSGQEGHVISGGRLGVAPEPRTMEPSCVVASGLSGELDALQARVVDTLTEARAPSTRRLYALKWGVFVKWCHQAHIDPVVCTMLDVLSFLQYRMDSGSLPSTLKVYVAGHCRVPFTAGWPVDRQRPHGGEFS